MLELVGFSFRMQSILWGFLLFRVTLVGWRFFLEYILRLGFTLKFDYRAWKFCIKEVSKQQSFGILEKVITYNNVWNFITGPAFLIFCPINSAGKSQVGCFIVYCHADELYCHERGATLFDKTSHSQSQIRMTWLLRWASRPRLAWQQTLLNSLRTKKEVCKLT